MRKIIIIFLISVCIFPAISEAESLPGWMIPLREAIYEQILSADQVRTLYLSVSATAGTNLSGTALDIALSRCEYFMGRAYLYEERNQEARTHFTEGLRLAERAVSAAPNAEAWALRAENLAHLCQIGSVAYVTVNGPNVERYAKNALTFNSRNALAQYLIAARWVYAPWPFNNIRRGIEMMMDIIDNGNMEKDDRFNVYSAIGYAYIQQRRSDDARIWLTRSLEIYPTNKYVAELLRSIR